MSDLISRAELFNRLATVKDLGEAYGVIQFMPTIEERKKGKWIWDDEGYHCSECFFHAYGNTLECYEGIYRYCPNCGADMREGNQ